MSGDTLLVRGISMHGFAWDFVNKKIIESSPFGFLTKDATQFPIIRISCIYPDHLKKRRILDQIRRGDTLRESQ